MSERAWEVHDSSARTTLGLLRTVLRDFHPRDFRIQMWDGSSLDPEANQFCRFTWKLNSPSALAAVMSSRNRQVALAEQYVSKDFDIEGDIEGVFPLADYLIHHGWSLGEKLRFASARLHLVSEKRTDAAHEDAARLTGRLHTRQRDRQAVRYHYDMSNDFYALWLDKKMVYSCAYFEHQEDDIDTAQDNKLDCICQKLQLKAGERLLDIGCGWGGLIIHAARNYGVHALGISLSKAQVEYASARIQTLGLSERCAVELRDYRDVPEETPFDKVVSVGMVEHVGVSQLATYFAKTFRLLRPGGLFLNSGISTASTRSPQSDPTFTDMYIFPDGELATISSLLTSAEQAAFEIRTLENMREHYASTTRRWLQRLEARAQAAEQIVGEPTYRRWRLYLAGSTYYFTKGWLELYQTLLLKSDNGKGACPRPQTEL